MGKFKNANYKTMSNCEHTIAETVQLVCKWRRKRARNSVNISHTGRRFLTGVATAYSAVRSFKLTVKYNRHKTSHAVA